ncbi:MAG: hypothetical protein ABIG71_04205 [Candidatus Uhrbacteria bacterium]
MIPGRVRTKRTIKERQRALLMWYERHGRHSLPWRHNITPYGVLVSEVMLQQTQVDRVVPYFERWMRRWPTVQHLARARRASVIRAWAGLGYNTRAVNIHRAAQEIARDSMLRKSFSISHEIAKEDLQRLPGVGSYTAHAVRAFAWNVSAPCVDTNVRRVLAYVIYKRPAIMKLPPKEVERLAARVVPEGKGRVWNYALMDYGALVLRASDIPKKNRPIHTVGKFEGSSRYWRGRIIAVLGKRNTKSTPMHDREQQGASSVEGRTMAELCSALKQYGEPPRALSPLLRVLVRDGLVVQHGQRYSLEQ